ncbi:hypothetical protein U8518_02830 [Aeromonas hydrophila]|nr:hypothetical protein [Aeromonas hydrophila]WRK92633.1 hypothetical protein U8518_02830 [Aeromonas hydrophila]
MLVVLVVGCVSRFAVVGALKHGFTVIVSIIRPENSHCALTQQGAWQLRGLSTVRLLLWLRKEKILRLSKASKVKRSAMPTFDAFFEEWLECKQVAKPTRTSTVKPIVILTDYISKAIGSLLLKDVTRAVLFARLSKV